MKVCPRCGRFEEDPTATFCVHDGTKLEPAIQSPPSLLPPDAPRGGLVVALAVVATLPLATAVMSVFFASSPSEPVAPVVPAEPEGKLVPVLVPRPGRVDLMSDPPGAEVFEGQVLLCSTPCQLEPSADPRQLRFVGHGQEVVISLPEGPVRLTVPLATSTDPESPSAPKVDPQELLDR